MESSQNQIIINTSDASGVIRNINYSPDRNISIINSSSGAGSDVNFTDAVTLDFLNKTASATITTGFTNVTLNSQYGVINLTYNGGITGNGTGIIIFKNSFITTSSIIHLKFINYSGTMSTFDTYPILIIRNIGSGTCDINLALLLSSPSIGTTLKYFFYIY
jgi:hypothetical protein